MSLPSNPLMRHSILQHRSYTSLFSEVQKAKSTFTIFKNPRSSSSTGTCSRGSSLASELSGLTTHRSCICICRRSFIQVPAIDVQSSGAGVFPSHNNSSSIMDSSNNGDNNRTTACTRPPSEEDNNNKNAMQSLQTVARMDSDGYSADCSSNGKHAHTYSSNSHQKPPLISVDIDSQKACKLAEKALINGISSAAAKRQKTLKFLYDATCANVDMTKGGLEDPNFQPTKDSTPVDTSQLASQSMTPALPGIRLFGGEEFFEAVANHQHPLPSSLLVSSNTSLESQKLKDYQDLYFQCYKCYLQHNDLNPAVSSTSVTSSNRRCASCLEEDSTTSSTDCSDSSVSTYTDTESTDSKLAPETQNTRMGNGTIKNNNSRINKGTTTTGTNVPDDIKKTSHQIPPLLLDAGGGGSQNKEDHHKSISFCNIISSSHSSAVTMSDAMSICKYPRLVAFAEKPHAILHYNAAFARLTGLGFGQVVGKPFHVIFPPPAKKSKSKRKYFNLLEWASSSSTGDHQITVLRKHVSSSLSSESSLSLSATSPDESAATTAAAADKDDDKTNKTHGTSSITTAAATLTTTITSAASVNNTTVQCQIKVSPVVEHKSDNAAVTHFVIDVIKDSVTGNLNRNDEDNEIQIMSKGVAFGVMG